MKGKVKSFKQTLCGLKTCNKCSKAHNHFDTRLLPCRYTLLQVRPEIRCSNVSSRYCCYGNHAANL